MADEEVIQSPDVAPPDTGGDGQGPTLTDAQKKELHGVVTKMILAKEPESNIKLVVDRYTSKYGTAPKQPISETPAAVQSFPGTPDFTNPSSYVPGATSNEDFLKNQTKEAAARINTELLNSDRAIGSILTKQKVQEYKDKVDAYKRNDAKGALPMPDLTFTTGERDKQAAQLKPVIMQDPLFARKVLEEQANIHPEKAGQIKADIYRIDARNRPANAPLIAENASKIEKGDLDYNLHTGQVQNKQGFFSSLGHAYNERIKARDDYNFIANAGAPEIIEKLEKERKEYNPDQPINTPVGVRGFLGEGIGSQNPLGLAVGAMTAAVPGAEEMAPWTAAYVSSPEIHAIKYVNSLKQRYNDLRNKGAEPGAALEEAQKGAAFDANVDLAQGALLTAAGVRAGVSPVGANLSKGFVKAVTTGAQGLLKGTAKEAIPQGFLAAGLQGLKNIHDGKPVGEGMTQVGAETAGIIAALGLLIKAPKGLAESPEVVNQIRRGLAQNYETSMTELGRMVADGNITPEDATRVSTNIEQAKITDSQIPPHITDEETRVKLHGLIDHRAKLEEDLKTLNKAYHPAIKQKIADLDEQIQKTSDLSVKEKPEGETPKPKSTEGDKELTNMPEGIAIPKTENNEADETVQTAEAKEAGVLAQPTGDGKGYAIIRNVRLKNQPESPLLDKPYLPDEVKTQTVKPQDAILVKGVPLSDINIPANVRAKVEANIKKGSRSTQSDNPVAIKYNSDGTLDLMDGAHRVIEAEQRGDKNIDARVMNVEQDYETFKPKENAIQEPSPSGVLQHPQEGAGAAGGERERVESSQQGEESTQARGEESKTPGEEEGMNNEGPPPVDMGDLPFTPGWEDVSGITHEAAERTRQQFGLGGDKYESQRKYDIELNEQADKAIHEGYDVKGLITKMAESEHHPSDLENTILKKYKAYLSAKLLLDPSDANLADMRRLSKATDLAGTLQGRAFRSRQGMDMNDNSLGSYFNRDMEAAGTETLTPEHKAKVIQEYEAISETQKRYEEKIAQLQAENSKLKAAKEVKKASAGGRQRKSSADYGKERSQIVDSIKEKLRKARGETNIVVVPYAKELIAIAPDVAKLVKSIASEGIDKLEDVITAVKEQLKDVLPEITDKDIHNIIAGEYSDKRPLTELQTTLRDLKTQAQLVNKLEALERGEQPKTQKARTARSRAIEELRAKIKDFEKAQSESGKFYQEEIKKTPLERLKDKMKKQIYELESKIAAGDYSKPEKSEPIKLDREAIELQDQLISLKQEREKRLAQLEYDKKSTAYHAYRNAMELINIPRTVMASADFSAPLRQGAIATVAHPVVASKAAVEMFKSAVSQKNFDRWLYNLKEKPIYKVMEDSGLYIADPNSLSLTAREEAFMSHAAEKIPLIGETLKIKGKTVLPGLNLIKGSERAYTAYLNKMRADLFTRAVDSFASEGKTFENSPDLYKAMAKFINAATGRGELPGVMKSAAPALNSAFFSPRLIASRLQLLNPVYYIKMPPAVRQMALMDMAKFIGVGTAVVYLAHLAGADVETDGRSPDFGKIKVGNTRWDVWGGFQQYVRVADQLVRGQTKSSTTGNINSLTPTPGVDAFGNTTEKQPRKTRGDVAFAFFRGKLAPVPGTVLDYLYGKDVVGHKFDPRQRIMDLFTPMVANDVSQAWKNQGYKSIFTVGIPSAFGVGVQTYGDDKKPGLNDVK